MGIGTHEGVGIGDPVFFENPLGQIFQVNLVDDSDPGRHDREGIEGLLAPFKKLVAFTVADEFDLQVPVEGQL
jgi:hypothetical protein